MPCPCKNPPLLASLRFTSLAAVVLPFLLAAASDGAAQHATRAPQQWGVPCAAGAGSAALRLMTFNIRLNTPLDGDHAWPARRTSVVSMIRFHAADVLGAQEVLREQRADLVAALPDFACLGVGRDDGQEGGELCPLFVRQERLEVLEQGTFWLSATPETPGSRGWDAYCNRIGTWARLRERDSQRELLVLNTHLDHMGVVARREGARLLRERLLRLAGDRPAFLLGDFNAEAGSEPLQILTQDGGLVDSASLSELPHHGPSFTFQAFDFAARSGPTIDFVLLRPDPAVHVRRHAALADHWDGRYPSDHFPVLIEVTLDRR
jgi:endonuclease/exonuclease/phosphatase family metal-dependent hydrolase